LGSSSYRWRNLYLSGSLTVAGTTNVGSLQVGGTTVIDSSRVLQNVASVNQSLSPSSDNTYDLGSSTYRWRNAYFSGSLTVAGGITASGAANVGSLQIGGTTVIDSSRNLTNIASATVSGTANVGSLQIGGTTVIDSSRNLLNVVTETLVGQTANPTLAAGRIWFRSDLRQILWSPDGTAVKQVFPADWGDITNKPPTFPPSAHASTHKPGGSDAMFPADYSISPAADNTYDLGSSTYRWRNAYFSGSLTVAGAANVGSLQIGGTTVIDSSRNLQNANWISGVMRRDTGCEIFRCQNDTAQTFTFALRNAANTGGKDHFFVPSDDYYGYIGSGSQRWYEVYAAWADIWHVDFRGSGNSYFPYDSNTHHYLVPFTDGYSYIGQSSAGYIYRLNTIRTMYLYTGDMCFEDTICPVCGEEFKVDDAIVLKVRAVDEESKAIRTVPVHAKCNPHPLDPELMKMHEELLKPYRGSLPPHMKPKCWTEPHWRRAVGNPEPLEEGEFEVVSVTVEDEDVMMVNCVCWDGTALSFPAPVDADEATIAGLANEYYALVKRKEAEREARRARGRARLRRDWRGFKAKLATKTETPPGPR
jgi:hypothetical protein